jgi:hypothetical protein
MARTNWLTHVLDTLSDAHQNVIDQALMDDTTRQLTEQELELVRLIDTAFNYAHQMRLEAVRTAHV